MKAIKALQPKLEITIVTFLTGFAIIFYYFLIIFLSKPKIPPYLVFPFVIFDELFYFSLEPLSIMKDYFNNKPLQLSHQLMNFTKYVNAAIKAIPNINFVKSIRPNRHLGSLQEKAST